MTPEQRIKKMFELTEMTRYLLKRGLEIQFPEKTKEEIHKMWDYPTRYHDWNTPSFSSPFREPNSLSVF
jgi:hypothetical protein